MNQTMTFHETYGSLPKGTLGLIKRYNVSQSDFDVMLDLLGQVAWDSERSVADWTVINNHILDNSPNGYYQPRYF